MTPHSPARTLACAGGLLIAFAAAAPAPAEAKSYLDFSTLLRPTPPMQQSPHKPVSRRARLTKSGRAIAPAGAPTRVRQIIRAGNRIAHKPYLWGGGHGAWRSAGYDCSGSVSYALHGGDLLKQAMASGGLAGFGQAGKGRWVTVYANGGHAWMIVAGLRFDTTAFKQGGSRWTRDLRGGSDFTLRHPKGL